MTTRELQRKPSLDICIAKMTTTPAGETKHLPGDPNACAYGPVEVAWYPDRLRVTAFNAGPGSITNAYLESEHEDVVVEIRLPNLDELTDNLPGAD